MPPLIVIVGETASGKSALAMELAERFDGEIICADSRTIYKGMDIGTAKPSAEDRSKIPHHMLDIIQPDESFSAAEFQRMATEYITDISSRGRLPILVGGTGLYIDSVLFEYEFRSPADPASRKRLEDLSVEELQAEILAKGYTMPENTMNKRYLVRVIETEGEVSRRHALRANTLVLGLQVDREKLRENITLRVDEMVRMGFVDEARDLTERYSSDAPGLQAPGYKAFREYLNGSCDMDEAKALFVKNDMSLAKRQRTWFKRSDSIHWVSDRSNAVDFVTTFLNKTN